MPVSPSSSPDDPPRWLSARLFFILAGGLLGGYLVGMRELAPRGLTGGIGGLAGGLTGLIAWLAWRRPWPLWVRLLATLLLAAGGLFLIWDIAGGVWLLRLTRKSLSAP